MDDRYEVPVALAVMQLALMAWSAYMMAGSTGNNWNAGLAVVLSIGSSILIFRHAHLISTNMRCISGRAMVGVYLLCLMGQLGPSVLLFGQPVSFVGVSVALPSWMIVCALFSKSPEKAGKNQDRS